MQPYLQHQLTQLRVAEMHRQGEQSRIAADARRARRTDRARRADRQLSARPFHRSGAVLQHLLRAVRTGYGHRLRPAATPPQLAPDSRR